LAPAFTLGVRAAAPEHLNLQPVQLASVEGQDVVLNLPLRSAVSAASPGRALLGVQGFVSCSQGFQLCLCPAAAGHLTELLVNVLKSYPTYFNFFSFA